MQEMFELLLKCYLSGQITEQQWTKHLADPQFENWVCEKLNLQKRGTSLHLPEFAPRIKVLDPSTR